MCFSVNKKKILKNTGFNLTACARMLLNEKVNGRTFVVVLKKWKM